MSEGEGADSTTAGTSRGEPMVAVAAVIEGLDGSTTTRVPTFTRVYRSVTSSFVSRMQPEETKVPMVEG